MATFRGRERTVSRSGGGDGVGGEMDDLSGWARGAAPQGGG